MRGIASSNMSKQPIHASLRRQATYALTAFVIAALALEAAIPGSVLPFLDIVPLGILAAGLLLYDASRRARTTHLAWIPPAIRLLFAAALIAAIFLLVSWDGRAGMVAAALLATGAASLAFWPEKW
jgi:hypothetical protein